jgi:hypothetical protein
MVTPIGRKTVLAAQGVRSLIWDGDTLVDWVAGGRRFGLDGSVEERYVNYAYPFDSAVASPSGRYVVIYARLQTKGLVLRRGEVLREINRSFYQAANYEYPITLLRTKSGTEILAHCPDEYNRLEFDELETGRRLTDGMQREPSDVFHSRLAASTDGRWLLSSGWIWHPVDDVRVYDVERALGDPSHLDGRGVGPEDAWGDTAGAAMTEENELIVAVEPSDGEGRSPAFLRYDLSKLAASVPRTPLPEPFQPPGTMMAVGNAHVLGLYNHPKLYCVSTGTVVCAWPEIASGTQASSILLNTQVPPPIAMDPKNRRIAIAGETEISILQFES